MQHWGFIWTAGVLGLILTDQGQSICCLEDPDFFSIIKSLFLKSLFLWIRILYEGFGSKRTVAKFFYRGGGKNANNMVL